MTFSFLQRCGWNFYWISTEPCVGLFFAKTSIEPPGISAWTDRHAHWQPLIWPVDKDDSQFEEGQSSVIICSVHRIQKTRGIQCYWDYGSKQT